MTEKDRNITCPTVDARPCRCPRLKALFGGNMFKKIFGGGVKWIVAGLGNPGSRYEGTRHNMGYMALDYMAEKEGLSVTRNKFQALTAVRRRSEGDILYMKPLTYMNLSGNAVGEAARFHKVPADHVIILCDDVTLAPGTLRLRDKGSAGGHNGLKSIEAQLGGDGYLRVRIGVGGKDAPTGDELVDFVLGKPSKEDMALIEDRYEDIRSAVELLTEGEFTLAQSRYSGSRKK